MQYMKPVVSVTNELSENDAVEWAVVAIVAILAVGGVALYCIAKGGSYAGSLKLSSWKMSIGCKF